jgi:hypothetical protein
VAPRSNTLSVLGRFLPVADFGWFVCVCLSLDFRKGHKCAETRSLKQQWSTRSLKEKHTVL